MLYDAPQLPFHPGSYLKELLIWRRVSLEEFADITGIPETDIADIVARRRGIDQSVSEGLAEYFGNSSQFWLKLQTNFDHRDRGLGRAE